MENIIRRITATEVEEAMALVWEVFQEFEVPFCSPRGRKPLRGLSSEIPAIMMRSERGSALYTAPSTAAGSWPFYLHLGFIPLSEEQERDGLKFTPMKYVVNASEWINA